MTCTEETWTLEDEKEFRRLNSKRMKLYRDKTRKRKYSPRQTVDRQQT